MSEQEEKEKEVNEQGNVDNKEEEENKGEEKKENLPHPNEISNEQPKEEDVKNDNRGEENIDKNNNAEEIKQVEQIHEHPEEDNKPIEDKNDNQQIEDNKPEEKKEEEKVPEEKKEEPTLESLKEMIKEKDLLITQLQSEKESLLVELSNEKVSHENEVSDLLGKLEVERVFHDVQRKTESQLNDKIISMKSMITELHNQFQKELEQKDKICFDKVLKLTKQNEEHVKKEAEFGNTIKLISEKNQGLLEKNIALSKEKVDLEDIILKQEEKLNVLIGKVSKIEVLLQKKNKILKENETYAMELINIVEEQKTLIKSLKSKQKEIEPSSYLLNNPVKTSRKDIKSQNQISYDYNNDYNSYNVNVINQKRDYVLPKIPQSTMNYLPSSQELNEIKEIKEEEQNMDKVNEFRSMMNKLMSEIEE